MNRRTLTALLAGALLLPAAAVRADEAASRCALQMVASLDIRRDSPGAIRVPVQINGQPTELEIDTGGVYGVLNPAAVAGLRRKDVPVDLFDAAGGRLGHYVRLHSFRIGDLDGGEMEFLVGGPGVFDAPGLAGTLGANVLNNYDVEIDPGLGKFRLFKHIDCSQTAVYWKQVDATSLSFELDQWLISFPVVLDGKPIRALLDTGADESVMDLALAKDAFGLTPDSPDMAAIGNTDTVSGRKVQSYSHRFKSLQIGDITISNPMLTLGEFTGDRYRDPNTGRRMPQLVLGMHELRMFHIYIAYRRRKLYLSTVRGDAVAAGDGGGATPRPAALTAPDRLDAVAAKQLWDSARTHMDRQEYDPALADLNRAVAQVPNEPALYQLRAQVQIARKAYPEAIDDLGHVLALKGDDAQLLFARAQLYAMQGDPDHAREDMDRALALDPAMAGVHLARAGLALNRGDAAKALPDLDQELKLHPDSDPARAARCQALAMLQRYRQALPDCDAVIKAHADDAQTLDLRARIDLNRGATADAIRDFSAVLKLDPARADALYGRGLARLQRGDPVGAQADMQAGVKLDPNIASQFTVSR